MQFSEIVGKGSFKTVYKGQDLVHMNMVAWNEISLRALGNKERKRVILEIQLLNTLQHPNLLPFFGAWVVKEPSEKLVFTTELMSSGTLRECVHPGKRGWA